jgi:hypothetical protein
VINATILTFVYSCHKRMSYLKLILAQPLGTEQKNDCVGVNKLSESCLGVWVITLPDPLPERWMELAQDRVQWRVLVQMVMNIRFLLPNNYLVIQLVRVLTFNQLLKYLFKFLQLNSSPVLFDCVLEYAIKIFQANQEGLKLNGKHQLLV